MSNLIKLTLLNDKPVLLGVDSIIRVRERTDGTTEIDSRHAMVISTTVQESVEEVYKLYKDGKNDSK